MVAQKGDVCACVCVCVCVCVYVRWEMIFFPQLVSIIRKAVFSLAEQGDSKESLCTNSQEKQSRIKESEAERGRETLKEITIIVYSIKSTMNRLFSDGKKWICSIINQRAK